MVSSDITDMKMPVCDGTEMLREIEARGYECEIIVLSEYTDFVYLQQAIHARVCEYLLKPIDTKKLNEYLAAACVRIQRSEMLRSDNGGLAGLFRLSLTAEEYEDWENVKLRAELEVQLRSSAIRVAFIKTQRKQQPSSLPGFESAVFEYDRSRNISCVLAKVPRSNTSGAEAKYIRALEDIRNNAAMSGGDARIGASDAALEPQDYSRAWSSALAALGWLHRGRGAVVMNKRVGSRASAAVLPGEQEMTAAFDSGNGERLDALRRRTVDLLLNQEYVHSDVLGRAAADAALTLEKLIRRAGCDMASVEDLTAGMRDIEWLPELDAFLERLGHFSGEYAASKRTLKVSDVIDEIISVVENGYAEEVSLLELSKRYHFNYIYLSRLFKERTGKPFSGYLIDVRMKKARELIEKDGLTMKEAAPLVGYTNQYYFISSYEKYYALSKEGGLHG